MRQTHGAWEHDHVSEFLDVSPHGLLNSWAMSMCYYCNIAVTRLQIYVHFSLQNSNEGDESQVRHRALESPGSTTLVFVSSFACGKHLARGARHFVFMQGLIAFESTGARGLSLSSAAPMVTTAVVAVAAAAASTPVF